MIYNLIANSDWKSKNCFLLYVVIVKKHSHLADNSSISNLPFLVVHFPLLKILARDAAKDGFSATINAVFILTKVLTQDNITW